MAEPKVTIWSLAEGVIAGLCLVICFMFGCIGAEFTELTSDPAFLAVCFFLGVIPPLIVKWIISLQNRRHKQRVKAIERNENG